ncbi:hypothetical protein L208DRAFT_1392228 [Tricholoma matsutake]|nr:hypothetical protein L208DRAFT_1392228 [Tricholoma matsutake 945]
MGITLLQFVSPLIWPLKIGHLKQTFPWPRIGEGPDFLPFWLNISSDAKQQRTAVSKLCSRVATEDRTACEKCREIPDIVEQLVDLASHAASNTPQLKNLLIEAEKERKLACMSQRRALNSAHEDESNGVLGKTKTEHPLPPLFTNSNLQEEQQLLETNEQI